MTRSGTTRANEGHGLQSEDGFWYWDMRAENGEIISDSAEGYRHEGYAITMAQKFAPDAELVIDD